MSAPLVVAIDPGPSTTGIVGRWRDQLLAHGIAHRRNVPDLVDYGRRILERAVTTADLAYRVYDARYQADPSDQLWAIEVYNTPTPHLGQVDPKQIAETAWLVGWLYGAPAHLRPAHRPGAASPTSPTPTSSSPTASDAPARLAVPTSRPQHAGVSHCRSAWDVAGAAAQQHRTRPRRTA